MRRILLSLSTLVAVILLAGVGAARASDPEVDGTWDLYWGSRPKVSTITVDLHQSGMALTGTALIPPEVMEDGAHTTKVPIMGGTVAGDHVVFQLAEMTKAGEMTLAFNGVVTADTIEGYVAGVAAHPEEEVPFDGIRR